jgi:hypothetical protein
LAASASVDIEDEDDAPPLDPVPQKLHAGIEASFPAAVPPLA